jgi:hypothetical protein
MDELVAAAAVGGVTMATIRQQRAEIMAFLF